MHTHKNTHDIFNAVQCVASTTENRMCQCEITVHTGYVICGIHTSCGTLINKSLCTACLRFFLLFHTTNKPVILCSFFSSAFRPNERRTELQKIKRIKNTTSKQWNKKERKIIQKRIDKNRTEMKQHLRALQW